MKLKLTAALLIGVLIGVFAYRTWDVSTATARHWKAVREYSAYMREPANFRQTGNGHTVAFQPLDPKPHLAALVSVGALIHADIVLPSIPYPNRAATEHWRTLCEAHPDEIVFAFGGASPGPTHLQFWFTEAGRPLIDQLIEELKAIGEEREPTSH